MNRCLQFFLITLLAGVVVACESPDPVQVAGSSTVLPVVSRAAEQFRARTDSVKIIVNGGGSGVGINQLGEGKVDIGMSSRALTDAERERFSDVDFVRHVVGRDVVLPVVSAEIYEAGVRQISMEELRAVYRGDVTNWTAFGGPDREILVVDKEPSRGTRHVFMEAVFGDPRATAPGADLVLGSNNEEQTALVQSDAALGMLSFAWQTDDVEALALERPNGSVVQPIAQNIRQNRLPFVRDLLLFTNGPPNGAVASFIEYVRSESGQAIVESAGYVRVDR